MSRTLPENQPTLLKPWEIVDPHAGQGMDWLRVTGCNRHAGMASAADLAPPPPRPGSEDSLACPSRVGDTLRHRDGRVTDLAGNPIAQRLNNYVFTTGHREFLLEDTDRRFYAIFLS